MKNNKGMTLVEVVVVIALIAIVTSGTVLSVSSLRRARVKKQYDTLQSQVINLREKTLTSSDLTAGAIYYDSTEKEYFFAIFEMERTKLSTFANLSNSDIKASLKEEVSLGSNMDFYYSFDTPSTVGTKTKVTESDPLIIHFDRSDGKLVNNEDYKKDGKMNIYVENSASQKQFSVSCATGRVINYN